MPQITAEPPAVALLSKPESRKINKLVLIFFRLARAREGRSTADA